MLAHMQLKFKTAELKQEEVLEDLPKAIRSSIAQHLFLQTVERAYLFKGLSEDLIVQLVKELFPCSRDNNFTKNNGKADSQVTQHEVKK